MKTLILTLVLVFAMISFSFANEKSNPIKDFDTRKIVSIYVEAINLGNTIYNKHLFADNFEFTDGNNETFNKKDYLTFLKQSEGLVFDCTMKYEILDETTTACLAKATTTFPHFTRVDYINLIKTDDGWKISKIVASYPQSRDESNKTKK